MYKTDHFLPRQARDKHRENSKKITVFDPGVKGLSSFGMENPLIKLEYERKQTPPPGVFDFVVQHCAQSCEPTADGDGGGGLARTQSSLLEAEQEGFAGMLEDELGPVQSTPSFGVSPNCLIIRMCCPTWQIINFIG